MAKAREKKAAAGPVEPAADPGTGACRPAAGGPSHPLILAALILTVFLPMLAGKNFLQFSRNPDLTAGIMEGSGQRYAFDLGHFERWKNNPWLCELEPAWFTVNLPQDLYVAREIRRGRFPLWDPYSGCGMPTIDGSQYKSFNPLKIPFYIYPGIWTWCLSLLLGLVLGAAGTYILLRRLGMGTASSAVGAAVFSLNPWVMERLALHDAAAYFFIPWCLLGLLQMDISSFKSLAIAALPFVFMAHAGHLEVCVLVTCAVSAFYLFEPRRGSAPLPGFKRGLPALATAGGMILIALCAMWLPLLKMRWQCFSYKDIEEGVPIIETAWRCLLYGSSDMYILPAIAALLTAAFVSGRFIKSAAGWVAAGILFLLPLPIVGHRFAELLYTSTGFVYFYFKPLFWAGLSILAACGAEAILSGSRRAAVASFTCGGLLLAACVGTQLAYPLQPNSGAGGSAIALVLVTCCTLLLLSGLLVKSLRLKQAALWIGLIPLVFPLPLVSLTWNSLKLLPVDVVEHIRQTRQSERVISLAGRPAFTVAPNWGQALGLRCAELNSPIMPNKFFQLFYSEEDSLALTFIMYKEFRPEIFRRLGATLMVVPNAQVPGGIPPDYRGAWASAYALPGSQGRLYFANSSKMRDPASGMVDQLRALEAGGQRGALIEAMGQPAPSQSLISQRAEGIARFSKDDIHEVRIEAESGTGGLLVLKDTWYPGWRARVDGREVPLYRVDGCFRGVEVPPGKHSICFSYSPLIVYLSGAISFLYTMFLLIVAILPRRGARSSNASSALGATYV